MEENIIITGGRVIDPSRGIDGVQDVFIKGARIVENDSKTLKENSLVIDAEGCLVLPGLIDFHAHVFFDGTDSSIPPDVAMLPNCVTTAVDGGSSGTCNYEMFRKNVIANSLVRIKSFLSLSPIGQATSKFNESEDPKYYDEDKIKLLFRKYSDELLGLKLKASAEVVGNLGITPVKRSFELAEELGCSVAVHTNNPVPNTVELVKLFRKGDIFTHVYHGSGSTIIGEDGHVLSEIREARERGVIFDAANGKSNFGFDTAIAALADGFEPDIISSDLTWLTMFREYAVGLPWLMSKYLALGMNLNDIVAACTSTPARFMGMENEIGTLSPGACADVAILKPIDHECKFTDIFGRSIVGQELLLPQMTIRDGRILFRQLNF